MLLKFGVRIFSHFGQLLICSRADDAAKPGDWMKGVTWTMYVTAGCKLGWRDYFAAWPQFDQ